jgi:mannose-1-phosphate guanylyltransferase
MHDPWVLVLAGGEGARVRDLTRDEAGRPVPKQFCRFPGRPTLLATALGRARRVTRDERIVPLVQASHARWWSRDLAGIPRDNVIAQRGNHGTALAILRGLGLTLARDPGATLVVMPSDHDVEDEAALCRTIRRATAAARAWSGEMILVGAETRVPDAGLGWIVPAANRRFASVPVARFREKPEAAEAAGLIEDGALVNTLISVATGRALERLYAGALPAALGAADDADDTPPLDFARDLLERSVPRLRVLRAPDCGWSDVGTPARLEAWLVRRRRAETERGAPLAGRAA